MKATFYECIYNYIELLANSHDAEILRFLPLERVDFDAEQMADDDFLLCEFVSCVEYYIIDKLWIDRSDEESCGYIYFFTTINDEPIEVGKIVIEKE